MSTWPHDEFPICICIDQHPCIT